MANFVPFLDPTTQVKLNSTQSCAHGLAALTFFAGIGEFG